MEGGGDDAQYSSGRKAPDEPKGEFERRINLADKARAETHLLLPNEDERRPIRCQREREEKGSEPWVF